MRTTLFRFSLPMLIAFLFFGCATEPALLLPPKLELPAQADGNLEELIPRVELSPKTLVERMPVAPQTVPDKAEKLPPKPAAVQGKDKLNLNFEQVPLTTLIQVVYAEILGRPVNIDPKVMERRDLVTFRTPEQQTADQIVSAMQLLLKSYGIAALDLGDLVRVVPDTAHVGYLPEIRRGISLPETPEMLRPIFQLVDLQAVRNTEVAGWIRNMFGDRVSIQEDPSRNALLLSGTSDNVAAAMEAIRVLDQPVMKGRASARITPAYIAAQELATRLQEILTAEGYSLPADTLKIQSGGIRYPILILSLPASNALLVFTMSDEILAHVQEWVSKLDLPNDQTSNNRFFTYSARNTSAENLAKTLSQMFQVGAAPAKETGGVADTTKEGGGAKTKEGGSIAASKPSLGNGSRVVVDQASNTLIFQVEAAEYTQLNSLLRALDKPAKSALIEVTVAEIKIIGESQLGFEWLLQDISANGAEVVVKTLGGLNLGKEGLNVSAFSSSGDAKILLNALATSNKASILSSPRIMARNGETATIQVGDEVPIITSQQSTLSGTTPEGAGVLQTVQYRNTGVILNVKPVIYSDNRIDLEIEQEVSKAAATKTGVSISPTISNRKVQTKMSLLSGSTVLLGGLISKDNSGGHGGIPWLQDIPVLGMLFRSEHERNEKIEMIILITPYILDNNSDAQAITEAFKSMLPSLGEEKEDAE